MNQNREDASPTPSSSSVVVRQSTSTGENRKTDFPFFQERREPWFWFNNFVFLICLAAFLYFTVTIIQDFIKQRNDPPTATNLRNGLSQSFPAMAFCIHRGLDPKRMQPDLQPLFAAFDNGDENGFADITNQLKRIDCPNIPTTQNQKCWYLDGTFPAFDTNTCIRRNYISMGFTFNLTEYSREVSLLGIDGFLFEAQDREEFVGLFCRNEEDTSECSDGILLNNHDDDRSTCQGDNVGFETFFATTMTSNLIQLHRSETQASAKCDATIVQWNAATVAASVNPNFLDDLNITITDSASTVLMDFQFFSTDIVKTTYNPQSGVSMFGSLSGWFGCKSPHCIAACVLIYCFA